MDEKERKGEHTCKCVHGCPSACMAFLQVNKSQASLPQVTKLNNINPL
jgi:hypothetical protein